MPKRYFLLLLLTLNSCIDLYDKKYTFDTNLISIEGLLTDKDPFFVIIKQSRSTQRTEFSQPVSRATVELLAGNNTRTLLTESFTTPGRYEAPANFRGVVNQAYRLRIRLADNRVYESSLERLTATPPMTNITQEFNQTGIKDNEGIVLTSSVDVFIDTQDNPQETNFYRWRTFLYENQRVCATCLNGEWNVRNNECRAYRLDPEPNPPIVTDYECDRRCWQVYDDTRFNIFSDVLTNGASISKRLVRQVPFYLENPGALLIVEQMCISPTIYRYFDVLKQQTETTGTLTDVPPAPPIGNMRNVNNPEEIVLGYFSAAGITRNSVWIDRSQYAGATSTTQLGGREPIFEPNDPYTSLPKFFKVTCGSLRGQTPIAPPGWRF
ncbi:MAG: DUF4249 domain-containing protein [Runella sp.]